MIKVEKGNEICFDFDHLHPPNCCNMRGGCKKDDPNGCAVNPRLTKVAMISDMVQNCAQFTREQLLDELKPDKVRLLCRTHHAEHTDEQSRFRINSKDDAARQNDLRCTSKETASSVFKYTPGGGSLEQNKRAAMSLLRIPVESHDEMLRKFESSEQKKIIIKRIKRQKELMLEEMKRCIKE